MTPWLIIALSLRLYVTTYSVPPNMWDAPRVDTAAKRPNSAAYLRTVASDKPNGAIISACPSSTESHGACCRSSSVPTPHTPNLRGRSFVNFFNTNRLFCHNPRATSES